LVRVADLVGGIDLVAVAVLDGVRVFVGVAVLVRVGVLVGVAVLVGIIVFVGTTNAAAQVLPFASLFVPSGQMVLRQVTPVRVAALRFAPVRFAPFTFAPLRFAPANIAPIIFDPDMLASVSTALVKSTPANVLFARYAPARLTLLRSVAAANDALGRYAVGPSK
jgi:hypothetical protein